MAAAVPKQTVPCPLDVVDEKRHHLDSHAAPIVPQTLPASFVLLPVSESLARHPDENPLPGSIVNTVRVFFEVELSKALG